MSTLIDTKFKKGQISPRKGMHLSDETKQKKSEKMKLWWTDERREELSKKKKGISISPSTQFKKGMTGEKSVNWKGGIAFIKKEVKERDNYTCQVCGLHDNDILEVDHIVPVSVDISLKYEKSNLTTLCPNCHRRKTLMEIKNKIYNKRVKI